MKIYSELSQFREKHEGNP